MSKYKFTEEEKETLMVTKLNQDMSDALKSDIRCQNNEWSKKNDEHEQFLSQIEKQLGITPQSQNLGADAFQRETPYVKQLEWGQLAKEADKKYVSDVYFEDLLNKEEFKCAYQHIKEIDEKFEKKTGLCKKDIAFLVTAIGLQCIRQYIIDPWIKEHRTNSSSGDEKGQKKNADPGWYYVPTANILINRVPFDAQNYNHSNDSTVNGFLKGAKDHRYVTLGHDPILGWVFGTANILTSTITRYDFVSAHVKNDPITKKNYIHSRADNDKIWDALITRWKSGFKDGKVAFALAIVKEAKHLKSDVNTKDSLPLPGVMAFSPEFADKLAKYGVDVASVGTETSLSVIINWIIAVMHRLCFDETVDNEQFYEVRTRKIILYSNLIASTSNVITCYLTENWKNLDVGGLLITITRLISDVSFICKVKDEFVENGLDKHFNGIRDEMERLYESRFC